VFLEDREILNLGTVEDGVSGVSESRFDRARKFAGFARIRVYNQLVTF
jgi:hypothetical protein